MNKTVEITRYPNRRLYDRQQKKYINVGEIEAMVLEGRDVRVTDSKSGEDLTRLILTQVILERHPERMKMFPVAFLHEILRADQVALDWFAVYFGQAKTLMESVTSGSGLPLVPGLDFWQAFMPGEASRLAAGQAEGGNEVGDDEEGTRAAKPTGQTTDDDAATSQEQETTASLSGRTQQEMAFRLVALEQRLMQLERETKEAKRND